VLLSIIDLLDREIIKENEVLSAASLLATFERHFEVVRKFNDQPTIEKLFFPLSGVGFWQLAPAPGQVPLYETGRACGPSSFGQLKRSMCSG
jgi:hypothetical protein